MKFKIGDYVDQGIIVAIYDTKYFYDNLQLNGSAFDKVDKNWRDKPLYAIKLYTPSKPLTKEEFIEQNQWIKDEYIDLMYNNIKEVEAMTFPEKALKKTIKSKHIKISDKEVKNGKYVSTEEFIESLKN